VIAGGNGAGCDYNQFYNPVGIALDSTRQLYVADSACNQMLKFPANSSSATFGMFIASLGLPQGIYIDQSTDDLYVAVYGDNSIVKFANGSTTPMVVAGA
jgi:DNA-binding beta-propeller fold protein YncE